MKTLKVLLQEVVSGIKAWVNSNFAQESNTVHKTGDETVNGVKTFSSANILSEVNRVDKGLWFNGQREAYIFPENAASYSGLLFTTESYGLSFKFGDSTTSNDEVSFNFNNAYLSIYAGYYSNDNKNKVEISPRNSDESSLGTSTYQWNNLYAKNYYYNGTAWGLDQNNTWSAEQIIEQATAASLKLKNSNMKVGNAVSDNLKIVGALAFTGSNGVNFGYMDLRDSHLGNTFIRILSRQRYDENGDRSNNGTNYESGLDIGVLNDKTSVVCPTYSSVTHLGTSTNKWKSFNGLNPGTLSFPNYSDTTYIDISGSIVPPTGETEINKNLGDNHYTPPVDGWLSIRCDGAQYLQIYRNIYNCPGVTSGDGTASIKLIVTLPVRKNETYTIRIKKDGGGTEFYQLYPCLGNV